MSSSPQRRKAAAVRKAVSIVLSRVLAETRADKKHFAKRAHISRPHLYQLVRGRQQPSLTVFFLLADASEVHAVQFLRQILTEMATLQDIDSSSNKRES